MAPGKIETVREAFAAFERRDKEGWEALTDPQVEFVPIGDWPESELQGREGVWDFMIGIEEPWEPGRFELEEITEDDDHVAARMRRNLRGKGSGIEVEYDYWVVFSFRDGKVTRAEWFEGREDALEAAGLADQPG
jgi:ketosteroid isomerase-like protein